MSLCEFVCTLKHNVLSGMVSLCTVSISLVLPSTICLYTALIASAELRSTGLTDMLLLLLMLAVMSDNGRGKRQRDVRPRV